MDGPEECQLSRDRKAATSHHEPPHGGRKVRRALKNARTLISELFAREKSSVRQGVRRGMGGQDGGKFGPCGLGGDARARLVDSDRDRVVADDGSLSERDEPDLDDFSSYARSKGGRTRKTALDTLSSIDDDSSWDDVCSVNYSIDKTFDDQAAMVQPGLFIGAFLAEQNKEELDKKGITHILQVGDNLTQSFEGEYKYLTVAVADTETACIFVFFKECFEFIDEAKENGGGVLVHCFAGISRSATVCISYLMWKLSLSLGAAHFMVESARPCTQPNDGFKTQLQMFESFGCDLNRLEEQSERIWDPEQQSSDEFDI